jgi:hypothetical protein
MAVRDRPNASNTIQTITLGCLVSLGERTLTLGYLQCHRDSGAVEGPEAYSNALYDHEPYRSRFSSL